jgi:hypothetical protein
MTRLGWYVTAESIVIDGDELPRVGEPWRRVLEPLTDRQLAACARRARDDHREHVCAKPSANSYPLGGHLAHAAKTLAEATEMEQHDLFIRHELLMWGVSEYVSRYWSHVTDENRRHHPGSKEDYLRSLVQRIKLGVT